jgi:hypothetical protein
MDDIDMPTLLARVIKSKERLRGKMNREEFIAFLLNQIYCYGGDATCMIVTHYGEGLRAAVEELVKE